MPALSENITDAHPVRLTDRDAVAVLQDAIRESAPVDLIPNDGTPIMTGVFAAMRDDVIRFTPDDLPADRDFSGECIVVVQLHSTPYRFASTAIGVDLESTDLLLDRPRTIDTRQRRRFWRADLRRSTDVVLSAPEGTNISGQLLNISLHGLACRVGRESAATVDAGRRMTVSFVLDPEARDSFRLDVEIRARTDAGDPTHVILRAQFIDEAMSENIRSRLENALQEGGHAP